MSFRITGSRASFPCSYARRNIRSKTDSSRFIWGRPSPDGKRLKDTILTRLAPEVWTGLYAPLFMFSGDYEIGWDETEKLYRARLAVRFRNAMDLGQYAYPFWHDAKKWNDYQAANAHGLQLEAGCPAITTVSVASRGPDGSEEIDMSHRLDADLGGP